MRHQSHHVPSFGRRVAGLARTPLCVVALSAGLAAAPGGYAQGTTAGLGGTVSDPTGAVIPRAVIELKNVSTGDLRTTKSNGSGVFAFSALPSGDYVLTVKAPGFNSFQENGIHLDPGDLRSTREIRLNAGAEEAVTVTTATAGLTTDSGELSNTISAEDIQHLAVEGRDVTELLKILPGMSINPGSFPSPENRSYDPSIVNFTGAIGNYSGNGTPINATSLLTDGADITDPGSYGIAIQNVNYDQVAEVKVQTGSFTADTARGPIVINAIGKSGGDKFHGSLYVYARTNQLNSVDWIANHTGQGKPPDRQIYPGATLGGPVLLPGTNFNHSRKLSFFVAGEDYAQRNVYAYGGASTAILGAIVPTAGMRNGDFSAAQISQYLGSYYQPVTTNGQCSNSYGNTCAVPQTGPQGQAIVNGNIAPYMDAESKLVFSQMPLPNLSGPARTGAYNYITTNLVNNNLWQARGRMDYDISNRNKLFGSYSIEKGTAYEPNGIYSYIPSVPFGNVNTPGGGEISSLVSHVASINFTSVLSSSLTNEFYAAGAYFSQRFRARNPSANSKAPAVTATGNPYTGLFNNGSQALVSVGDYGYNGLPFNTPFDSTYGGYYANKQIRTAGDNVTKLIGQHTFRAGVFYQWASNPQSQQQNTGGSVANYYMPATFTDPILGTTYNTDGNGISGNYLANFAEGHYGSFSQVSSQPFLNVYFWNFSGYVQDHWRITPHLSIDLGVRLEHFTPWIDAHNTGIAIFDPADYAATAPSALSGTSSHKPGILYHAINSSVPLSGITLPAVFAEPRGGFAWDACGDGHTTVRGGFGIYRQHDSYNDVQNPLNTAVGQLNYTSPSSGTLATTYGFQRALSGNSRFAADQNVNALLKGDSQQPVIYTYNFAIDQQLGHGTVLEVAYAGNHSQHLINSFKPSNINALPVDSLFAAQPNSRTDTAATAGRIFPLFSPAGATGNNTSFQNLTQPVIDSYRLYPLYNAVNAQSHTAFSNYNGLQTQISKTGRYGRAGVNYTWSKAMGATAGGDPTNIRNDYNLLSLSRKHIININYAVFSGSVFHERALAIAGNGWEFSGYMGYQSGPNMPSIYGNNFGVGGTLTLPTGTVGTIPGQAATVCATNPCTLGVGSTAFLGTPDVSLQPVVTGQAGASGNHRFANGAAFGLPSLGTNGSFHYGYIPGPGFFDADISATRHFKVGDHGNMSLRFSGFNFPNHPVVSFSGLDPSAYTLNYTSTVNGSNANSAITSATNKNATFGTANFKAGRRILEMSLRYDF